MEQGTDRKQKQMPLPKTQHLFPKQITYPSCLPLVDFCKIPATNMLFFTKNKGYHHSIQHFEEVQNC
jgi:hypothetical protein